MSDPHERPMRVVIAGSSGMIGTALVRRLQHDGHAVVRLVRRAAQAADEATWAPESGSLDPEVLRGANAVVNLAGASLMKLPWTASYKAQLRSSRIDSTRTLVTAMSALDDPPGVFLSGSAIGYYGDRPGERLTEDSARGSGFLADLCDEWEQQASGAPDSVRVVMLRTGLVLGPSGALSPIQMLARLFVAGPLGDGKQGWSWISLRDEVGAIAHLLHSEVAGPVNLTGPEPVTAGALIHEVARQLHRPYWFPAPRPIIEAVLGDAGRELLLASQNVLPLRLLDDGYVFRDATVQQAVAAALDQA